MRAIKATNQNRGAAIKGRRKTPPAKSDEVLRDETDHEEEVSLTRKPASFSFCPCFKTPLYYGVVSGCFVYAGSPSPRFRPKLAPKRGLVFLFLHRGKGAYLHFEGDVDCLAAASRLRWRRERPSENMAAAAPPCRRITCLPA